MTGYFNRRSSKTLVDWIGPDILHQTYYPLYTPDLQNDIRIVTTVHDMIYERFSDSFPSNEMTAKLKSRAVDNADMVICVSESTKRDLIEFLSVDEEKIAVVHHGANHFTYEPVPSPWPDRKPYLLYVGIRERYKNFRNLLEAYAASKQLMSDFDLLCFGSVPFETEELALMSRLSIPPGKVRWTRGNDELLKKCYQHAAAFVYPSLYEGFGIPPLEAMMQRCPVISSNTSSIPEVAGDAAEFFNPGEPHEISQSIRRVVYDSERSAQLRELGKKRVEHFTWERCAMSTLKVYQRTMEIPR